MSVYKRHRGESEMEFYNNAIKVRKAITKLCMNEKVFPKRTRFIFAIPMLEEVRKMTQCITYANTIYPSNKEEAQLRKSNQNKAIGYCESLLQEFQYAYETLPIPQGRMEEITGMLVYQSKLLKAWRKKDTSRYKFNV